MGIRKIVVLTPIKNEDWILKEFLSATSAFADCIIIADQQSTDNSRAIINQFPKAHVIENKAENFNEADRQVMLLNEARRLFPGEKIIFTLDADEIISANSYASADWGQIKNAGPNTVFRFEKPQLYGSPFKTIRYPDNFFPLGFVDDDSLKHNPLKIHSTRFPVSAGAVEFKFSDIKFLHAACLRPNVQRSKYRFYSVQENILGTAPWYRRRRRYRHPNHMLLDDHPQISPKEWNKYPSGLDIKLQEIKDLENTWHDREVARLLQVHGFLRFWLDDIWDKNWNNLDLTQNPNRKRVIAPPMPLQWLLKLSDKFNK